MMKFVEENQIELSDNQEIKTADTSFQQISDYGNLKVLCKVKGYLICLGPHCKPNRYKDYVFLPTFLFFIISVWYVAWLVDLTFENRIFKIINIGLGTIQVLSYLAVALSDPGVIERQKQKMKPKENGNS